MCSYYFSNIYGSIDEGTSIGVSDLGICGEISCYMGGIPLYIASDM